MLNLVNKKNIKKNIKNCDNFTKELLEKKN